MGLLLKKYLASTLGACFFLSAAMASYLKTTEKDLKSQIIELSYENMTNESNQKEIRQKMDILVAELQKQSPKVDETLIGQYSPGSWRQIWSDERNNTPNAPTRDLSKVYQVVSAEGWGYNFGERWISPTQAVTFVLAVKASVQGDEQTTEITKAYFRPSGLVKGEELSTMALSIHSGKSKDFIEREAGQFPNGPIGAKADLKILFIDKDLKIGISPNVYDGASEMFVMQRMETVQ